MKIVQCRVSQQHLLYRGIPPSDILAELRKCDYIATVDVVYDPERLTWCVRCVVADDKAHMAEALLQQLMFVYASDSDTTQRYAFTATEQVMYKIANGAAAFSIRSYLSRLPGVVSVEVEQGMHPRDFRSALFCGNIEITQRGEQSLRELQQAGFQFEPLLFPEWYAELRT